MSTDEICDGPTPVESRAIEARHLLVETPDPRKMAYNHTIFCQTSLPFRNPGDDVREVTKTNGAMTVEFTAGKIANGKGAFTLVGLPYGPRARLVLIHLMTEAVLNQSPKIELEDSLTAFARHLELGNGGRDIRTLRDQMLRMSACSVRISMDRRRTTQHSADLAQFQAHLIEGLQLFSPTAARQRALWPSYVMLNQTFFESMMAHAVPLDPRALRALKHSASALDCYQWLSQRLHRVNNETLVPWGILHEQLGGASQRIEPWKANFIGGKKRGRTGTLSQVLNVYPAAQDAVEVTESGLILRQAEPPVPHWGRVQQRRHFPKK